MTNKHFVLLNEADNVCICVKPARAHESVNIGDFDVVLSDEVMVGHKVARRVISKGEKILKYGVSIGEATRDIAFGEHVHIHNMKSDYIASHTRESATRDA